MFTLTKNRVCYHQTLSEGNSEGHTSDKKGVTPDGRSEIKKNKEWRAKRFAYVDKCKRNTNAK